MISLIAYAIALLVATVAVHAVGTYFLLRGSLKQSRPSGHMWISLGAAIRIVFLLLIHLLEVSLWAVLYYHRDAFPDFLTSFHFSVFATFGYGDFVIKEQYRTLGGVEKVVGVMMISWSTALLVGYLQAAYTPFLDRSKDSGRPA